MFRDIELATMQVEAILQNYMLRGELQPRGQVVAYLNDHNWTYLPVRNAVFSALAADRRVGEIKQSAAVINKNRLAALSILREEEAAQVQLPTGERPVVFYVAHFAIQGNLHVRSDAPDEDILDDLHDFFPVSEVTIFPVRPVATPPTRQVPLLLISRPLTQAYQVIKGPAGEPQAASD
ncbi:MAG: hypothetical protein JSW55_09580 [Chloroflexota bacterium]|nr:MAG: hypothetical protein JSW55_09580 [Chloroflexota bacterium]